MKEQKEKIIKRNEEKGITLIALVITIIILLILATVTLNVVLGEGGLIDRAQQAKDLTEQAALEEQEGLNSLMSEFTNIMAEDELPTEPSESDVIEDTRSYVGCYADIDGDESIDGIIYADLAIGGSGQWGDYDGIYSINKESNFKKYKINGSYTTEEFGTKEVIISTKESGNERFYVMALSDISSDNYYFYYNALGNIEESEWETEGEFGNGKSDTIAMLNKWKDSAYGTQNNNDMWTKIETLVDKGWYVPSREEWAAFLDAFEITGSNYDNKFGLSTYYWASTPYNNSCAWSARFDSENMYCFDVDEENAVRLGITF